VNVDLKAVIYFAHIARTRSFSRSAAELGVAQPWLSARIRRLEARLGCSLFERTTRSVKLTAQGERLLSAAEMLSLSAASVEATARDLMENASGKLRIGSPPFASRIMRRIELVELFAAKTSALVEMDIGWSARLMDRLKRGDLDAAFVIDPFDENGLEELTVCDMGIAMFARPSEPLAERTEVSVSDLCGKRIGAFVRSLNPGIFDLLYEPLQAAGAIIIELPEVRRSLLTSMESHSLDMVGLMEALPMQTEYRSGSLVTLPIFDLPDFKLKLVRRALVNTEICDHFWSTASDYLHGALEPSAARMSDSAN